MSSEALRGVSMTSMVTLALLGCGEGPSTEPNGQAGGPAAPDPLDWCIGKVDHKPVKLVGGSRTMLILFDDGTAYCMGDNYSQQCDGTTFLVVLSSPVQIANLPCLTDASISSSGLGVLTDGRAIAWGGAATPDPGESGQPTNVQVLPLDSVSFVYSKDAFQAAIADNRVYWWGVSYPDHAEAPTELPLAGVAESLGGNEGNSCYVFGGGTVACRGRSGLLGPGQGDSALPVQVDLGGPVEEVFVDGRLACVLRADGEILCWGGNSASGLGRGDSELEMDPSPAAILEPGPFVGVEGQLNGGCAWRASGEVVCWGYKSPAKYGPADGSSFPPRRVPHLEPARQVAMIDLRVCALGFDDQVRCDVKNVDPDAEPTAEILEFAQPYGTKEHPDAANR